MHSQPLNARSVRTRGAIKAAFASLLASHRYEELEVCHITVLAGIGRSTFYSHYPSVDALLTDSIAGPFSTLADSILPEFVESRLVKLLDHFWENRIASREILTGPSRRKITGVLVRLIEDRLKSSVRLRKNPVILPRRLMAIQLAEMLLAPVCAWLLGESRCSSAALAAGLRRASVALMRSYGP
jgi:AcrR family transcriptional regulator